jgi:hypothetical protein
MKSQLPLARKMFVLVKAKPSSSSGSRRLGDRQEDGVQSLTY